jgi:hypothetical protein
VEPNRYVSPLCDAAADDDDDAGRERREEIARVTAASRRSPVGEIMLPSCSSTRHTSEQRVQPNCTHLTLSQSNTARMPTY